MCDPTPIVKAVGAGILAIGATVVILTLLIGIGAGFVLLVDRVIISLWRR